MPHKLDPSILEALSLDASNTTLSSHGGSGFAFTGKVTSIVDGEEKLFFVKTGKGKDSAIMFAGTGSFLATDFLDLSSRSSIPGSGLSLAHKLAKLHSTPAPTPPGHSEPQFGFPVPTCCGNTQQDNSLKSSWAEFYAENRLRGILRSAQRNQGADGDLERLVDATAQQVVPRLLGDGHLRDGTTGGSIRPVVVHGDLWSGNHGRGAIGAGGVEEVVFDPSSAWAHGEFEFGIVRMFGGFGARFETEYFEAKPKDHPVDEFEDRVLLYELYHHLNHFSMFGGSYRAGAIRIMEKLIKRYGG